MARYEIKTLKDGSPVAVHQLERAVARLEILEEGVVTRVDVGAAGGRVQVAMDLAGWGSRAIAEAERVFALVWYDAFGDRTARHLGKLV
jgi:hypothetical protein